MFLASHASDDAVGEVSQRSAGSALDTLETAEVLNRTPAARNHQIYEAHEVFAAIEDVEGDARAGRLG